MDGVELWWTGLSCGGRDRAVEDGIELWRTGLICGGRG